MKIEISHYYVFENLFTDYMDAVDFCDKLNLSYSLIRKSKSY
jgi:hypothetical protein